jgi:D-inositol-3-phosphate glycosyltransferase
VKITLITGGAPHYEAGLVSGLVKQGLLLDVVGGDDLAGVPTLRDPAVRFLNIFGTLNPGSSVWRKLRRLLTSYLGLMHYAMTTESPLFHLQWPYKFVFFDRTLLNVYYKALGKKLVFTAHNIDQDARDGTHSWSNQISLRFLYWIVDHIIVHTNLMKAQLVDGFGIKEGKVSVIPHGVMSTVPESSIGRLEARRRLGLGPDERVLLFFGLISPYKGLEHLISAVGQLRSNGTTCSLLIAGRIKECQEYWESLQQLVAQHQVGDQVRTELRHIPDNEVEIYFKAADVLVMPYNNIFQSGVLFLSYRFGLPVIAADVGSMGEDVVAGVTGYVFRAKDAKDLARTIEEFFSSLLYRELETRRRIIRDWAFERYSWTRIGELTSAVYTSIAGVQNVGNTIESSSPRV